jgi:tRNA A-37 threonylcarbamoyl transferase component Bud32
MSKVVGTYTGRFDVYGKLCNIKIQIISVPKQKNKIVMTGQGLKNINGSLLSVKKLIPNDYVNMYGVFIGYQSRGSYQGGPMHNFKNRIALFSKDEKHIDKLLKFLEKHITKKKVRRTKKKSKTRRTRRLTIKKSKQRKAKKGMRGGMMDYLWSLMRSDPDPAPAHAPAPVHAPAPALPPATHAPSPGAVPGGAGVVPGGAGAVNIEQFELHSEQGTTAKIYTALLNGQKVLFKIFNNLSFDVEKEISLQREASNILKEKQSEFQGEFKRLMGNMINIDRVKYETILSHMPTAIIPEILDEGNYEEMNAKYGGKIPQIDGAGHVIVMEYIDENTVFQDLKEKNMHKINLYKEWSRRSDIDEIVIDSTDVWEMIEQRRESESQYSMQYNYLTNLLVSVLNILNNYNISHNDATFKNVMVKFTDDGKIKNLYLVDFGQAQRTNSEVGGDYQFNVFNMALNLENSKRWFPGLYAD